MAFGACGGFFCEVGLGCAAVAWLRADEVGGKVKGNWRAAALCLLSGIFNGKSCGSEDIISSSFDHSNGIYVERSVSPPACF